MRSFSDFCLLRIQHTFDRNFSGAFVGSNDAGKSYAISRRAKATKSSCRVSEQLGRQYQGGSQSNASPSQQFAIECEYESVELLSIKLYFH